MPELMTDTSPDVNDDLAAVEAEMFGRTPPNEQTKEGNDDDAGKPEGAAESGVGEGDGDGEGDQGSADAGDPDEGDGDEGEDDAERTERQKRSTANRIKKAVAQQRYWEREAEARAAKIAELEAKLAGKPTENQPLTAEQTAGNEEAVQEPDPTKYRYGELDPQFLRDLSRFEAQKIVADAERKRSEAQQAAAAAQEAEQALVQVREKAEKVIEAATAKFSDFDVVVVEAAKNGDFALTQEMFETAAETAVAPDILYHLAKNPDEAAQVAEMTPRQQALWFGRMEAQFTSKPPAEGRKVTQASPPVSSLPKGSGGSGGPKLDDLDDPRALEEIERQLFGRKK